MLDAHQGTNPGVTPGLGQDALGGINQNYRQIRKGGTNGHIAGIFLVSGGVRHDKGTVLGGKIAVGDIDGDALLPLGHQAVKEKAVVDFAGSGAHLGVQLQGSLLIRKNQLGIVEHMANQR